MKGQTKQRRKSSLVFILLEQMNKFHCGLCVSWCISSWHHQLHWLWPTIERLINIISPNGVCWGWWLHRAVFTYDHWLASPSLCYQQQSWFFKTVDMKITRTCFSLHSDCMLSAVFLISLYICSFSAIVFPCGCFNRRNVCCLHREPEFVFLVLLLRFSSVKTAMLFKELVCLFSILPSALSSSLQFSRQKKKSLLFCVYSWLSL